MDSLVTFVRFEIWFLVLGLMLIVGYQILTGKINTKKLLNDKKTNRLSPGRVQLIMLTLVGALYYLLMTAENPQALPKISKEMLYLLGGSNAIYLTGKGASFFQSFFQREKKSDTQT